MNTAKMIRVTATPDGVKARLWVDDEEGRHVTVAELFISETHMLGWARSIAIEQDHRDQQELEFDD